MQDIEGPEAEEGPLSALPFPDDHRFIFLLFRVFTSLSGFDFSSAVEAVDGVVGREEEAELGQNLLPRAAQIGWPPRFA